MASRSAASAGEMLKGLLISGSPFVIYPTAARSTFVPRTRPSTIFGGMSQRKATLSPIRNLDSLLENRRRTADTPPLQSNIYLYAIGDLDERDAAGHSVVFAIKSHGAVEATGWCSFAIARESEFLRLGNAANGEVTLDVKCVGAGLNDFGRFESNQRRFFCVKEILTLQLVVLHLASGVDAVGFNLNV